MNNARFEGLTRIVLETTGQLSSVSRQNVVVDNILYVSGEDDPKYWSVPGTFIKSAVVKRNSVVVSLAGDALLGKGPLRGKMAREACITIKGSANGAEAVPVSMQGDSDAIGRCLIDPATNKTPGDINCGNSGRGCTYWLNMGNGNGNPYRIDHGTNPADWLNHGRRYSLAGMECNALLIVFDFPDARGADNTGIVNLPGDTPKDLRNFVNGHRLKTAKDYFDWVSGRNKEFMDMASFGNVTTSWTLLENSEPGSEGIYTLPYSLYPNSCYQPGGIIFEADRANGKPTDYPWFETNPENWAGYWFSRGGSTDNWNSGVMGYASVPGLRRDFDILVKSLKGGKSNFTMGYWAAAENAPGITYGQSFGGNGNIGPVLGLGGTKENPTGPNGHGLFNFSFMGADSYASFKYRHMTHELGHQMGLPDTYISGRTGYADPYTGKSDTFSLSGGFDHMGQIIGISPDFWAWVKWKYGWFRDDQVVVITENGSLTVELTPVETEGGAKLVVIPGDKPGVVYCLEYRGGKLGVNNIEKTERSNDPFDPELTKYGDQAFWDHKDFFGTDTQPGVLMYKINANANEAYPTGHTVVVDLLPRSLDNKENYADRYSVTLNNSLLGPASGVYEYTDAAFGITVSVEPEQSFINGAADGTCAIKLTKKTPAAKDRTPVLTSAEFVDMNTIQFTTNVDLRGLHPSNFRVIRDGEAMVGSHMIGYGSGENSPVVVNQMTSFYVRLTLPGTPFTYEDVTGKSGVITTVEVIEGSTVGALFQYLPSASVIVAPNPDKSPVGVVTLSNIRFISPTTIIANADKDLSGLCQPTKGYRVTAASAAKASLRIVKPDGKTVLTPEQISGASYAKKTGLLTIKLEPGIYGGLSETIGTSVEITLPVSSYNPGVTNPVNSVASSWYHRTRMNKTSLTELSLMASISGGFDNNTNGAFDIVGGSADTPIKTKLSFSFDNDSLGHSNVLVVEPYAGANVKTKLKDWLAGFALTHKYNGLDEFPMSNNRLELELTGLDDKPGEHRYTMALSSPSDQVQWAEKVGVVNI